LDGAALLWGTPTSRDHKDGACADADVETNGLLGRQVLRNWPTPQAMEIHNPNKIYASSTRAHYADGRECQPMLADVSLIVTLQSSLPDPETPKHGEPSSQISRGSRRRLNPAFVSKLMSAPWWWTHPELINSALEATAFACYKAQLLLQLSRYVQVSGTYCGETEMADRGAA
jgi:hypothetical protein